MFQIPMGLVISQAFALVKIHEWYTEICILLYAYKKKKLKNCVSWAGCGGSTLGWHGSAWSPYSLCPRQDPGQHWNDLRKHVTGPQARTTEDSQMSVHQSSALLLTCYVTCRCAAPGLSSPLYKAREEEVIRGSQHRATDPGDHSR